MLHRGVDACRAKEKIFHKLAKNYPSFPRSSVITTTPDNDKNSKEHNWNIKFPFVKIGDSKTLDGDVNVLQQELFSAYL